MARTPQDVTDTELTLLQRLWDAGPLTIRQLTDHLYPNGGTSKYATVQKLLERLEEDGYVARERSALAHTFLAAVDREELIGRRLRKMAEQLCGGSVTPLLTHLMKQQPLSASDRRELRALIDELDSQPKRDRKR